MQMFLSVHYIYVTNDNIWLGCDYVQAIKSFDQWKWSLGRAQTSVCSVQPLRFYALMAHSRWML